MNALTHLKLRKTILACAIIASIPCIANAESENKTKEIETLEVVGSISKTGTVKFYDTQSTESISSEKISDKGNQKVDETLSYSSSVINTSYGADGRSNWMKIRGLDVSYTLDGSPQFNYGYFGTTPEIYGLEKIEVLKGAHSELYGSSKPGGTVNMITKRPKSTYEGDISIMSGTHSQVGYSIDYSGLISDSVKYRLVSSYRNRDGQQQYTEYGQDKYTGLDHYYFAPSLTWDISNNTALTLLSSFQQDKGLPENNFLPALGTLIRAENGQIKRSAYYGEPSFDHLKRQVETAGYEFRHIFDSGLIVSQNYKYLHQDLDLAGIYGSYVSSGSTLVRNSYAQKGINNTHTVDNRLTKEFYLGKWRDNLMVGSDYMNTNMHGSDYNLYGDSTIDLYDPVYGKATINQPFQAFQLNASELGLYAQNEIIYNNKLIFNFGVRHSNFTNKGYWSGSSFDNSYSPNTYNGGLMYIFDNNIAPYVNYSQSFLPVYGYNEATKNVYKPYTAKQWESGFKYEPLWIDGTFTLAYFNIISQNAFVSNGTGNASQALETRSQGLETQFQIDVTNNLKLQLAYTYTYSKTDLESSTTIQTPVIPKHATSGWVNYAFNGMLSGLTAGTGLRYIGETYDLAYRTDKVPSYLLWDAMVKYQFNKSWTAQINATNLTDKVYIAGCNYWCYYGAERSVVASVNYKW